MAKFLVKYEEVLCRTILVEAEDEFEAEDKVREAVEDETIVLDNSDFCGSEINVYESGDDDEKWYQIVL